MKSLEVLCCELTLLFVIVSCGQSPEYHETNDSTYGDLVTQCINNMMLYDSDMLELFREDSDKELIFIEAVLYQSLPYVSNKRKAYIFLQNDSLYFNDEKQYYEVYENWVPLSLGNMKNSNYDLTQDSLQHNLYVNCSMPISTSKTVVFEAQITDYCGINQCQYQIFIDRNRNEIANYRAISISKDWSEELKSILNVDTNYCLSLKDKLDGEIPLMDDPFPR